MKHRAKTYKRFITEAYIDDSGELQDFESPTGNEPEYEVLDHAQRIQEFLEDAGAERVRLIVNDSIITFNFNYFEVRYSMRMDIDSEETRIIAIIEGDREPIEIYRGSTDSLFDVLANQGLSFLNP